jgi:hypothetical protein
MAKKVTFPKIIYMDENSRGDGVFFTFHDGQALDKDAMHEHLDAVESEEETIAEYKFTGMRKLIRTTEVKLV